MWTGHMDTGYVFCPYIPIMTSPTIFIDPDSYVPRKNILTRYGKKILAEGAKHYEKVTYTPETPDINEVNIIEED